MQSPTVINYEIRPCKFVERRMLQSVFSRMIPLFHSEYQYIGFGGLSFTDFKIFHRELHINRMFSIECGYSMNKLEFSFIAYTCLVHVKIVFIFILVLQFYFFKNEISFEAENFHHLMQALRHIKIMKKFKFLEVFFLNKETDCPVAKSHSFLRKNVNFDGFISHDHVSTFASYLFSFFFINKNQYQQQGFQLYQHKNFKLTFEFL